MALFLHRFVPRLLASAEPVPETPLRAELFSVEQLERHARELAAWHRVDAAEIWHWYAGAPLDLSLSDDGIGVRRVALGPDVVSGQRPQAIVPPFAWQMARSTGDWSLVGCTVSPAFDFAGFEMAPAGWEPGA